MPSPRGFPGEADPAPHRVVSGLSEAEIPLGTRWQVNGVHARILRPPDAEQYQQAQYRHQGGQDVGEVRADVGGNQELGTAWMVGPNHLDKGGWLNPFFDDVLTWCQGDLERDTVRRFKDVPWLKHLPHPDSREFDRSAPQRLHFWDWRVAAR